MRITDLSAGRDELMLELREHVRIGTDELYDAAQSGSSIQLVCVAAAAVPDSCRIAEMTQ